MFLAHLRVWTAAAVAGVALSGTGCWKTFHSERVGSDCKFRGVPTMMYKTHVATVTWSATDRNGQNYITQHVCSLPIIYAVDVCPAPVGKTEADFKMATDGQLTEASAKLDQEIPELIKAIGEAAKNLAPATGRAAGGITFIPSLEATTNPALKDFGNIIGITFTAAI